ncbi:MAG TPA: LLM class flavin-dependent oxidoreductase [Candidatus Xenobia bacterium]|jgi:alkanesulfonate monooxygenase SsuD/methylene tetrahydromethanopterin reductase-like flavin-dependent oxidoreductase (luciferase family)
MTRFGVALHESNTLDMLAAIRMADDVGVPVAWLTSSLGDQLTLFAAALPQTKRIKLGTAIVPIFPRHPVLLVQQVATLEALGPGRLELGLGPSHQPMVEKGYGIPFKHPLGRTREVALILRQAFEQKGVEFDGEHYHVHMPGLHAPRVPVWISALRPGSFRAAGEVADGGMAWICPAPYLRDRAKPALNGARLAAHCFLAASENGARVRADARDRLKLYPTLPFYAEMLRQAGSTDPPGQVGDWLIDQIVVYGNREQCIDKLRAFAATAGAHDLMVSLMVVEGDRSAGLQRAMDIVTACN